MATTFIVRIQLATGGRVSRYVYAASVPAARKRVALNEGDSIIAVSRMRP